MARKASGLSRKNREHSRHDVRRQVRVSARLPERHRIHDIRMPQHEFSKSLLGPLDVALKEFGVISHGY